MKQFLLAHLLELCTCLWIGCFTNALANNEDKSVVKPPLDCNYLLLLLQKAINEPNQYNVYGNPIKRQDYTLPIMPSGFHSDVFTDGFGMFHPVKRYNKAVGFHTDVFTDGFGTFHPFKRYHGCGPKFSEITSELIRNKCLKVLQVARKPTIKTYDSMPI